MIDNPQVKRVCNEVVRPTADRLAGVCQWADQFLAQTLTAEILGPLGITPEILGGENMPTEQDFPDEQILDGSGTDGRPLATRRKILALIRVLYQLQQLKNQTINGVPRYTESVAYNLAVNPRV